MRTTCWTFLLALSLGAASCSQAPEQTPQTEAKTIRVTVGSGPQFDIATRTELDPDGTTVRWAVGDRMAMWAVNASSGSAHLAAHPFVLWHYNQTYDEAKFTADIPEMPEGDYTYYAVSPVPDAVSGTIASYDIAAVQDGSFEGAHDILVAAPVAGGALLPGDNSEAVSLAFAHKIHLLKIHIPENRMNLPITRLTLTFPRPVTGRLTVDAADPDAPAQLAEGNNVLTLSFAEPKDAGDTVYAMIAPTELTADDRIEIKAYTESKESLTATMHGKNYLAGHTTPIRLTIPEIYRVTRIFFSLAGRDGSTDLAEDLAGGYGCSTLGERVDSFTLTAPAGIDLGNGSNVRSFTVNDANSYEIFYEGEFNDNLSGKQLTVTFDSENTLTSRQFTMPQIAAETTNEGGALALVVPWLYFEDFSTGITADFELNSEWKSDRFSNTSASQLSNLPTGWTGACVGGKKGVGIRVASHCIYGVFMVYSRCAGRVDSPPISAIKEGKSPKVTVSYTYGGNRFEGVGSGGSILVSAGYTTNNNNPIASDQGIANTTIPEAAINVDSSGNNNDYTLGALHARSYTIPQCQHDTRLSWRINNNRTGTGNGTYWIYIDNIKVSIAR